MTYTLIAFDLDGTLTKSRSAISQTQAELLTRLLRHYQVAVISGADWPQFQRQLLDRLPAGPERLANLYILPTNGGKLYHRHGDRFRPVWSTKLSGSAKIKIRRAFKQALNLAGINIPAQAIYGRQLEDRGAQLTWSALGQEAPLSHKQAWDPDHSRRRQLIGFLAELLPDYEIKSGGTTSVDVTPRGQTKGRALKDLARRLKVPQSKILYIGDALFPGGNDYSVKQIGLATRAVNGPTETGRIMTELIKKANV